MVISLICGSSLRVDAKELEFVSTGMIESARCRARRLSISPSATPILGYPGHSVNAAVWSQNDRPGPHLRWSVAHPAACAWPSDRQPFNTTFNVGAGAASSARARQDNRRGTGCCAADEAELHHHRRGPFPASAKNSDDHRSCALTSGWCFASRQWDQGAAGADGRCTNGHLLVRAEQH